MPSAPLPAIREPDEARAIGHLMADALGGGVGVVRDVHKAVSTRTFGLLGMLGLPARGMHNAISTGAYATVRFATAGGGRLPPVAGPPLPPGGRRGPAVRPLGRGPLAPAGGAAEPVLVARRTACSRRSQRRHRRPAGGHGERRGDRDG